MYIQTTSPSQLLMFLEILRFTQRFALIFLQTSLPEIWSDSTGFGHQVEGELLGGFSGKAWCRVPFLPFSARSLRTQPNVETKTAHYILNSETGSCPPVIFLVGWKKCSWAKDGHWVGAELVVKHMSVNSWKIAHQQDVAILRCLPLKTGVYTYIDMTCIYTYYVQF